MKSSTKSFVVLAIIAVAFLLVPTTSTAQGVLFVEGGNVGIGTDTPAAKFHVFTNDIGGNVAIIRGGALQVSRNDGQSANIRFSANGVNWLFNNEPVGYTFSIRDESAGNSPLIVYGGGTGGTLTVRGGKVGIGRTNPTQPLHMASGAYCSAGGTWVNASSRSYKKGIEELPAGKALEVFQGLKPVTFEYKASPEEQHVGFIAEDVPDLVATLDRKGISTIDIVGVLTKVVQLQQEELKELQQRLADLESQR